MSLQPSNPKTPVTLLEHSCLRLPVSSVFTSLALYFIQGAFSGSALNLTEPPDYSFPYPPEFSSVLVFLLLCFLSHASQWQDHNNFDVAIDFVHEQACCSYMYSLSAGHSHLLLLTLCLSVFSCHQMSPLTLSLSILVMEPRAC